MAAVSSSSVPMAWTSIDATSLRGSPIRASSTSSTSRPSSSATRAGTSPVFTR